MTPDPSMGDLDEQIDDKRVELTAAEDGGLDRNAGKIAGLRREIRDLERERDLLPPMPRPRVP